MAEFEGHEGVWRTIGGRRVFIRDGEDLSSAMQRSGKFSRVQKNQDLYKKLDEEKKKIDEKIEKKEEKGLELTEKQKETGEKLNKKAQEGVRNDIKDYLSGRENYEWSQEDFINDLSNEWGVDKDTVEDILHEEKGKHPRNFKNDKKETNDKPYDVSQEKYASAFKTYRAKRDKLEGITTDENGERNYDNRKDATWTGKEYTTEEFLQNLEDENWHTEMKMIMDAKLTPKQMEFVKDNTEFHNGSPKLDKETTEELIKGAKGEKYRKPSDIFAERKNNEIKDLESQLKDISVYGKYDDTGNYREGVKQDYHSYSDKKERYKQLTGKDFDDSNVKIPYDSKKTYEYPNGTKINQDLMKERYSGVDIEDIQRDIDFKKSSLLDYSPKQRELHNAEIKEMEKYVNSQPKYKSRISDDFGTKEWKEGYGTYMGGKSWKGTKSDSGLHGKDKIKAIDDEIKKAYPDLKTSRKTQQGGYTDSFSYSILESKEPLVRNINDFSDTEVERLWNKGNNKSWYKTKDEFKQHLTQELSRNNFSVNEYNIKDDYRLTPYGKQVVKDIMKVSDAYNFDESDSMTDYYHTGHYFSLSIGKDGTPYKTTDSKPKSMNDTLRQKGYQKYMKEHPASKMTFEEYINKK